jgi:hypothetical protein
MHGTSEILGGEQNPKNKMDEIHKQSKNYFEVF